MAAYRVRSTVVLRFEDDRAVLPNTEFSRVFRPEHEAALLAAGAITRLSTEDEIRAEWIAKGYVDPDPEPVAERDVTPSDVSDDVEE